MSTTQHRAPQRFRRVGLATTALAGLLLSGCSSPAAGVGAKATPAPAATTSGKARSEVPTVPGYDVGQFPPVPLFRLPDLGLLSGSADAFAIEINKSFADVPGVTVSPARCDTGGKVVSGDGSAMLYGDGSGNYTGPDGTVQNYGDGSGVSTINGVTIENYGDGSGDYTSGSVRIQNFGDGSGTYTDGEVTVEVFGDGSGNYTAPGIRIENYGDGSGTYTAGSVKIENFGDGSGTYTAPRIRIQNDGDGTATVNGSEVKAEKLATVAKLGSFPPISALAPITSCGTTITFQDDVLFDFDRSDIRPDAAKSIAAVAQVLVAKSVANAEISGHTDAIGDDADNQDLSERRARSVVAALQQAGAKTAMDPVGYGETRPVAPNEIDGHDDPAGRQLNRRVEIFIPAAA
ncbi:OmpA family protein [uncultured Microbacterium sp.]|uniref:OmpA family protein n=1 Tax=uncultured Microbacterium sp. TaxID=191216 RepID=UPI0025E8A78F|nr:OmpA family protein [uncultured Microbacterium sp.]